MSLAGANGRREVALIVGSGAATEIVRPVVELLEWAGAELDWARVEVPAATGSERGDLLTEAVEATRDCGLALKTRLPSPRAEQEGGRILRGPRNLNVDFRHRLGLYAAVRPIRSVPGLPSRFDDLDVLLVRENTEDIYKGIEHEIVDGVVQSLKVVTREACERITRFAFRMAEDRGREQITFVHKANILKRSDGLFLEVVREVAEDHPEIVLREAIVDAACMQLVLDPHRFDMILTGNLYGDILSSLGFGLVGGVSASLSINVSDDCVVFESVHGPADESDPTRANPLPLLRPAVALIRYLAQDGPADALAAATSAVLAAGESLTPDLGGRATAAEMCATIGNRL